MQIFHLNLFFAGQDFSTPYMADDLDRNMAREAAIELLVYTIYVIILSVPDNAEITCINIITNVYEYVYKHRFNYS